MAAVRNKKGRFSKTGVVLRVKKIGELKTSVVKDKPLIRTVEENKDESYHHNVSGDKLFEGSKTIDLFFFCDQAVQRRVYSMWGIAEYCTPRNWKV